MMMAVCRAAVALAFVLPVGAMRVGGWRAMVTMRSMRLPLMCDALDGPFWEQFTAEAEAEAATLGMSVESVDFNNGRLRVLAKGGVDELQKLNSALSGFIDAQADSDALAALPPFLLEVSSPGIGSLLTCDRDYEAFKGFGVVVTTSEPFKNKTAWEGTLVGRDEKELTINLKGRLQKIPTELIAEVRLPDASYEPGDPLTPTAD